MDLRAKIGTRAGRYTLRRQLGAGAMGAVFVAEHEILGTTCAVKVLQSHCSQDPEVLRRFYNEARAASSLDKLTTHIVRVEDFGTQDDGAAYIAMELLEGVSLERYLADRGRLSLHDALRIVAQIAVGLEVAHAAGIVHRDLKPANIFITSTDINPIHPKILDFGISKLRDAGATMRTEEGSAMGTPAYMASEQFIDASRVDARCDVYALAAIFYHLVTGRLPFDISDGSPPTAFYIAQQTQRPQQPDFMPPAVFDALAAGLAFQPSQRPASAKSLVLAIASQLAAEPPYEPSGAEIVMQWARRLLDDADVKTVRNQTPDAGRLAAFLTPSPVHPPPLGPRGYPVAAPPPPPVPGVPLIGESTGVAGRDGVGHYSSPSVGVPASGRTTLSSASGPVPVASPPPTRLPWILASIAVLIAGAVATVMVVRSRDTNASAGQTADAAPMVATTPTPVAITDATVADAASTVAIAPVAPTDARSQDALIRIEADPSGAVVIVDGVELGVAPQSFTRAAGARVELRLELRGYKTIERRITAKPGSVLRYELERRISSTGTLKGSGSSARPDATGPGSAKTRPTSNADEFDPDGVGGD